MTATAKLPPGFKVMCSECGTALDAETQFSPGQLKKKRPRCRACAPNKFKNQKTGGSDSKRENRYAIELRGLHQSGLITEYEEQKRYELLPRQFDGNGKLVEKPVHYIADFVFRDPDGQLHVQDAKGHRTKEYVIKRKLMLYIHHIRIEEI